MPLDDDVEEVSQFERFCMTAGQLMVHVGLMSSVAGKWPPIVQENWEERVEHLIGAMNGAMEEIQDFGEALDDQE